MRTRYLSEGNGIIGKNRVLNSNWGFMLFPYFFFKLNKVKGPRLRIQIEIHFPQTKKESVFLVEIHFISFHTRRNPKSYLTQ